jgi:hypothetical protein
MLLFVMAFVGNSLYVLSILTNPLATTPGYLLESIPYLLGSGGTLCFDLAIVTQSYLYSEKRKERKDRERRKVGKAYLGLEEAAALLAEEDDNDGTATDGIATQNNSRNPSQAPSRSASISGRRSRDRQSRRTITRSSTTELGAVTPTLDASDDSNLRGLSASNFDTDRSRSRPGESRTRASTSTTSLSALAEEIVALK